jgi:hypothetical protein
MHSWPFSLKENGAAINPPLHSNREIALNQPLLRRSLSERALRPYMSNAVRQLRPRAGRRSHPTVYARCAPSRYLRAGRPRPVHHRTRSRPGDLASRNRVPLERPVRSRRKAGRRGRGRSRRQPGDQTSLRRSLPEGPRRYRPQSQNEQGPKHQFRPVHRHSSPLRHVRVVSTQASPDAPRVPRTQSLLPKDLPNH